MISANSDELLIDRITHLASLVSDLHAVDLMLDTLRIITAKQRGEDHTILTIEEKNALEKLENDLKNYLTTQDPVRAFTQESLQTELNRHFAQENPQTKMKTATLQEMVTIFALSFTVYILGTLIAPGSTTTKLMISAPLFLVTLHAGLAWMFLSSRKEFVVALQKTYTYISIGLVISSFGSIQFPILFAYPQLTYLPIFRYAGFMPPFPVMCIAFYWGFYIFAKQLQEIKIGFLQPKWIIPLASLFTIIIILMPHPVHVPEEGFFDLSLVSTALSVFFSVPAALLGLEIVQNLTARYAKALRLFSFAQIAVALASLFFFLTLFISGPISGTKVALASLPFGISEVLMLFSAYLFKKNIKE